MDREEEGHRQMCCKCNSYFTVINHTIPLQLKNASLSVWQKSMYHLKCCKYFLGFPKIIVIPNLLLFSSHHPTWQSLLKMDWGIWSELKKMSSKIFFTLSHQNFSHGDSSIKACLWLICCGTSCLWLTWGRQRVLTVFTPNILLQVELIRKDTSQHRQLSTTSVCHHRQKVVTALGCSLYSMAVACNILLKSQICHFSSLRFCSE